MECMEKKMAGIAALIIFITTLVALSAYCVNAVFPKAPPITCPNPVNSWDKEKYIFSVRVGHNSNPDVQVKNNEIGLVTQYIPYAQPTRRQSTNDFPEAEDYYTIEIEAASRTYRYYLYAEGSQMYIEVPYEGVYTIEGKILDVVAPYFQD